MRLLALALGLLSSGCDLVPLPVPGDAGGDAAPPASCPVGFVGEASAGIEMSLTSLLGAVASSVHEGDPVPLVFPPQGGRVIFIGVRARNLDACGVTLTGALRDPASQQVRLDARTVNLVAAADGWLETDATDYASFSNIPTCPNEWSETDLFGAEYQLEVTVLDRGGRTATQVMRVWPTCAEPEREAECRCICKAGYVLGESCADAGAGDGGGG